MFSDFGHWTLDFGLFVFPFYFCARMRFLEAEIIAPVTTIAGMSTWQIVLGAALVVGLVLALIVAAMSRHKKSGVGDVDLLGAVGVVQTSLAPEGSVMVRGELWRARSRTGVRLERGRAVRIVGASQHLLEVEPVT
jgi:membrane-bound serine protease (ClpP class)